MQLFFPWYVNKQQPWFSFLLEFYSVRSVVHSGCASIAVLLLTFYVLVSYHLLRFLCLPQRAFFFLIPCTNVSFFTCKVWLVEFKFDKPSKKKKLPDNFSDWTNKDRVLDKQLNKGSGYRINLVIQAFYSSNPSLKPIILAPMLTDQLICSQRKSICRSGRSIGRQRADGASKCEQSRQAGRRR